MTNFSTWNQLTATLFLEELSRQGLEHIFVAPGSRSTPLVLAASQNKKLKIHTHFDERGLAYFALGCAKATSKPVAVVTTSGTAVSNLLPAITEAFYGQVPLIILSADRPPELIKVGANQAIEQQNIFKNFVHDFYDLAPASNKTNLEHLLSLAAYTYHTSVTKKGAVHINWHFQEPLAPLTPELTDAEISHTIKSYLLSDQVYSLYPNVQATHTNVELPLAQYKKILLIYGSMTAATDDDTFLKIAKHLQAPVFCDVQNPLRFKNFAQNISQCDLLLDLTAVEPDLILHFGGPLTSKRLNQMLEKFNGQYLQIHTHPQNLDPLHIPKTVLNISGAQFLNQIQNQNFEPSQLLVPLKEHAMKIDAALKNEFRSDLTEMSLFFHLQNEACDIFVGSSMPIRDLERFTGFTKANYFFNRGASGIDGNIATTFGLALNSTKKTICVLGDQAFLYDMNSLALHAQSAHPVHTIVVNNRGGGIFSFLPVKNISDQDAFHKFYTNPHEWNVQGAAQTFGLDYKKVKAPLDLLLAVQNSKSSIIEIESTIDDNVAAHRALTEKLKGIL